MMFYLLIVTNVLWAVVVMLINRHWRREYQQLLDVRKRFEAIFTDDGKWTHGAENFNLGCKG